jgi:hypothetical protein
MGDEKVLLSKRAITFFLVIALTFFAFGCRENTTGVGELELPGEISSDELETAAAQEFEIFIPDGKADRLPGSLKWNSVTVYIAGIDFMNDQPDGLLTNVGSAQTTITSTTTTKTVETTATTESSEQAGQSSGGSYTSTYTGGGGSISTDVTVDGSMSITESTTINNGGSGSSGTNWWVD